MMCLTFSLPSRLEAPQCIVVSLQCEHTGIQPDILPKSTQNANRSTPTNKRRLLNVYLKLNIIFCLKQTSVFAFEFRTIGGIKLNDQEECE